MSDQQNIYATLVRNAVRRGDQDAVMVILDKLVRCPNRFPGFRRGEFGMAGFQDERSLDDDRLR